MYDSHNETIKPPNEPILVDKVRSQIETFIKEKIIPSIVNQEVENKVYVRR